MQSPIPRALSTLMGVLPSSSPLCKGHSLALASSLVILHKFPVYSMKVFHYSYNVGTCIMSAFGNLNRFEIRRVKITSSIRGSIEVLWYISAASFLMPVLVVLMVNDQPLLPRILYLCMQWFAVVNQSLVERTSFAVIQIGEMSHSLTRLKVRVQTGHTLLPLQH
ncbi:hypothetical protein BaRGS_00029773 [Batillaria attramentaria]|uniref:Uncharacterized protein n=1 Tax=Batillaria attramentaria TaxID=370345 RepID=A0ABD0JWI3_9CAEN